MSNVVNRYFILNKPTNMVSQFVSPYNVRLLGDLDFKFPKGTHAVGRLDSDSEGLLLLTTNKKITRLLFQDKKHSRKYLVMVRNNVSAETLQQLRSGIPIKIIGGNYYTAVPQDIEIVDEPLQLYKYAQDHRDKFPHTWLLITLAEGKYHQVRKMVFNAGHRCYRLVRLSIENLTVEDIPPGEVKEIEEKEFFRLLELG
jgi:23S rRNA pseudouridine2457 synthase